MPVEFDNESHCSDFIRLNEQWILEHFSIEEADRKLAADPFGIIRSGGHILSLVEGGRVVGACAPFKEDDQRFQLARMAIEPGERGRVMAKYSITPPSGKRMKVVLKRPICCQTPSLRLPSRCTGSMDSGPFPRDFTRSMRAAISSWS